MKVIFHPGFHKTGTSTLQAALRANKSRLVPEVDVILSEDMPGLTTAAKSYSVSRKPVDLALVIYEAAQVAGRINPQTNTTIITSESLCGYIPGRNGVQDYSAAPQLLTTISAAFQEVHPNADQTFLFSTRAARPWLQSCYAQHLRASRMRLSASAYVKNYASSAQLGGILATVKSTLPSCKVESAQIEDNDKTRLGMLDSLLDLTNLPATKRASLSAPDWINKAPTPAQMDAFLEINQSDLSDKDARAARLKLNKDIG